MKQALVVLIAVLVVAAVLPVGKGATADRRLRVGYVVDTGAQPDPNDLFGQPYAAFIQAVQRFGIEGRVLQVAPNEDASAPLSRLARQRYDLVILGTPQIGALDAIARDFPHTKFYMPDFSVHEFGRPAKNVQGTVFRSEQAGFLAGYVAALMERRRPGRDVIGSVGGEPFPGVTRWITGYRQGARRADPGIVTLNAYTHDFNNPTKCRTVALDQIAKGAGAIFNVAGACGYGAIDAAKQKGIWGVGVDIDQSFLGRHILTSAVNNVDVAVFDALQKLVRGRFTTGGDTVFDLRNGGVGLGKVSPEVPASIRRQLDRVRRQIVAGKIKVQPPPNSRS